MGRPSISWDTTSGGVITAAKTKIPTMMIPRFAFRKEGFRDAELGQKKDKHWHFKDSSEGEQHGADE